MGFFPAAVTVMQWSSPADTGVDVGVDVDEGVNIGMRMGAMDPQSSCERVLAVVRERILCSTAATVDGRNGIWEPPSVQMEGVCLDAVAL